MAEMNDDELLEALGVEVAPLKTSGRTPLEERIIAGFEDILRFHQTHGRIPQHEEDRDIFERLYAVRLDQIRKLPEAKTLLADLDAPGLLSGVSSPAINPDELDEDALLAELGIVDSAIEQDDITVLRHVRPYIEIKAAEDIANRIGLQNVTLQHGDSAEVKGTFDFVVSRAVMDISQLMAASRRLIAKVSFNSIPNGLICLKGGDITAELKAVKRISMVAELTDYFDEPFFDTKKVVYVQL